MATQLMHWPYALLIGKILKSLTWWRWLIRYRVNGGFDEAAVLEKAAPHGQAGLEAPGPVLVSVRTAGGATTNITSELAD